jgi:hypothetical protein
LWLELAGGEVTVAFAFDTLGYAKRLREAGISNGHAEAHAEAAREFIMTELATRADLLAMEARLLGMIETQTLRITVRLGGIATVGFGVLAASIGVLAFLLRAH